MSYVISMVLMIITYICIILSMKHMRSTKFWNLVFALSTVAFYLNVVYTVYSDVGFHDWNFQNTLPVANVSPFMFTSAALVHIFPIKIKKHFYLLISLLSVGMVLAGIFGCVYNAAIHYRFHPHFICDYLAHLFLSLWGVYLIRSGQVSLTIKNSIISGSIIVVVAIFMLVLNLMLDTAFFGLSLNGKHNVYNIILTQNSYLSAMIYFTGLVSVLAIGFGYCRLLLRKTKKPASA